MGQRSQIYVRYNDEENKRRLLARYFQWNFSDSMISRANYTMLHLADVVSDTGKIGRFNVEKIIRVIDTNFDMKDIIFSYDIWEDIDMFDEDNYKFIFNQDNNDGQLFIDVTSGTVKYCFMKFYDYGEPMTAKEYMEWDSGHNWENEIEWLTSEEIECVKSNIETIDTIAELMSKEELDIFLKDDYSHMYEQGE